MKRIIMTLLVLGLLGGGGYFIWTQAAPSGSTTGQALPTPTALPPVFANDRVVAEAKVVPQRSASWRFETEGTVAEILVREGDTVRVGQELARLDTRDLELRVADARADVQSAQAAYDRLAADATPEQIAAAEAQVAQAQGRFSETVGQVTDADIASAQARLESAQAALNQLLAGPKETEITEAQARVEAAQATIGQREVELQQARNAGSVAKTNAERALEQATIDLQTAQSEYSTAYWAYENVKNRGRAPSQNEGADNPELSDYGNLTEYEAFKQAELKLQTAKIAVEQAEKDLEEAQRNELTDIAQAEQQVQIARGQLREQQAALDQLLAGADADQIASARAEVASAQASLAELTGQQRAGSVAAAEADVANAQAQLDELRAPKRPVDLGEARAQIEQATVALQQAELALTKASLVAPIDGTVAALNLEIGELAVTDQTVMTLADLGALEIQTDDLTELQVVNVAEGAPVTITVQALPDLELSGMVTRIKALGEDRQGDVTYTVTVMPDAWDARLRWNMTATVAIGRTE
jgi:HlyD family secretion protein